MGWLLPLSIRGVGTARVEALSSYLIRLAHVHATAPGTLLSLIIERYLWPTVRGEQGTPQPGISTLIRPNDTTRLVLDSIASGLSVESRELEQTTFIALTDALDRATKTFSPRLRWCPSCLSEQITDFGDAYLELGWQVLATERCDVHNVRLRDRCKFCGKAQDSYRLRTTLAECVHCGSRLDETTRDDLTRDLYSLDISSLVGYIAQNPGFRFPTRGVSQVLHHLLHEAWQLCEEDALFRVIPRDQCIQFADPDTPLTLISALRIAFWLNVPLVDLLLGELRGTNLPLLVGANEVLPVNIAPHRRRRLGSAESLAIDMGQIIEAGTTALPLREIARQLGVSVGALQYHLPKQSNSVIQTYLRSRQLRQSSISIQCRTSVQQAISCWGSEETRPFSKKRTLTVLRARTGLPKNVLREEIQRQTASKTDATDGRGPA